MWKNKFPPYIGYTVEEYILNEDMCRDILQQAINDALVMFPRMTYSCVLEDDELYCVENNMPLEVQITEEPLLPDGENLNGHLISFSIWGKRLVFICHHSLADGVGATTFSHYVIHRYAELMSGTASDVTETWCDVDLMNQEIDVNKLDYIELSKSDITIPKGMDYKQEPHEICYTTDNFLVNEEKFIGYVKERKASPTVAVGALLAKQLLDSDPEGDKPVNFDIPCNIRKHVGLENSFTNCVSSIYLSVTRDDIQKENHMEELSKCLKHRASRDYTLYTLRKIGTGRESYLYRVHINPQFSISYLGNKDIDNLHFIKKFNLYRFMAGAVIIDMNVQNGCFHFSVSGDNRDNPIAELLKNAFREIGLEIYDECKVVLTPGNGKTIIEHCNSENDISDKDY